MRGYKRWSILLVVFVLGLFLVYSSTDHRQSAIDKGDIGSILAATQDRAKILSSYTYVADVNAGTIITANIKSKVVKEGEPKKLVEFAWNSPQTNGTSTIYSDKTGLYVFRPEKNTWVRPNEDPVAKPFVDVFWKQTTLVDPIENLFAATTAKNKIILKSQKENLMEVEITPGEESVPKFRELLPPQISGLKIKNIKQIYTIDKKELLVKKYEVKAELSFFGISTINFNAVSTPSAFNKTNISIDK